MSNFNPVPITLDPGELIDADVEFFEYELKLPVVYVYESRRGSLGAINLDGDFRTFPQEEIFSYNSNQLTKENFLKKYPYLSVYFEEPAKQAA
jgi:hypothetical protein